MTKVGTHQEHRCELIQLFLVQGFPTHFGGARLWEATHRFVHRQPHFPITRTGIETARLVTEALISFREGLSGSGTALRHGQ